MARNNELQERFEEKYIPIPESGCWIWLTGSGYGRFWDGEKLVGAHRISWELHRGIIPQGVEVCHTCDTRSCVNPNHLFLGTRKDNMQDCLSKGRFNPHGMPGEKHPMAKLTEQDVASIRKDTRKPGVIAAMYNITANMVWRIKARRSWTHVKNI